jgi:hypothetical protein
MMNLNLRIYLRHDRKFESGDVCVLSKIYHVPTCATM